MSLSVRAASSLGGAVVCLILAALGEGGFRALFSHPPLIGLAVALVALAVAAIFAGGNLSPGVREDRGNRWVLPAFGLISLLLFVLPAFADRMGLWCFGGDGLRWFGVLLFAAGGALRLWPVFILGDRFSGLVAIQPGHTLVTSGLYSAVRNPSYLGLMISSLGWALAFRSGVGLILVALLIPPLIARMRAEEALLGDQFGVEYEAYRARTRRLIPGLY